jgi:Tol biopolymer transport system component
LAPQLVGFSEKEVGTVKFKTSIVCAVLLAAMFAILSPLTACGGKAATPETLPTSTVAFSVAFAKVVGRGEADIYVVNADGTGLQPLTETLGWEEDPSWSPDGTRVAYTAYSPGNLYVGGASVWVMNADGSGKKQLSDGYGFSPSWSPDGKQLVYVAAVNTTPLNTPVVLSGTHLVVDLIVLDADGGNARTIAGINYLPVAPSWTPDGDVLFLRDGDLYSIKADGTGEVRITTDWAIGEYALSPDGKTLAYCDLARDAIVTRPLWGDGEPVTLLEPATRFLRYQPFAALAWTPDGEAVAASGSSMDGRGGSPLYIIYSDGSGVFQIPGLDGVYDPSWRPK